MKLILNPVKDKEKKRTGVTHDSASFVSFLGKYELIE